MPGPSSPLANTTVTPQITIGGEPMSVSYSGLAPGEVGVYQINTTAPGKIPEGFNIPLVISQGGYSTTLKVRVVK